jgi:quercetin dioxygenase-like cupin family protein
LNIRVADNQAYYELWKSRGAEFITEPIAKYGEIRCYIRDPDGYTIRVKVPHGEKLMPHKHPEDRVYTVISGVFYIGLGDEFDASKLEAYPPGSVIILPGNAPHFHWAKSGEYVTQVTVLGPLGLGYLSAKDDPRSNNL